MAKTQWEISEEQRKLEIAEAVSGLSSEQWKAINIAFKALQQFDEDYFEDYTIRDARVPKNLKKAMVELSYEFDLEKDA